MSGCAGAPGEDGASKAETGASQESTAAETAAKAVTEAVKEAAEKEDGKKVTIGYDIYFLGNSWSVQLANIEDLIASGVDAIITTPCSSTALVPVLKEAREVGIKVVLLAAMVESNDYDCLIPRAS